MRRKWAGTDADGFFLAGEWNPGEMVSRLRPGLCPALRRGMGRRTLLDGENSVFRTGFSLPLERFEST